MVCQACETQAEAGDRTGEGPVPPNYKTFSGQINRVTVGGVIIIGNPSGRRSWLSPTIFGKIIAS